VSRRRLVIAAVAMVFAFAVGITVAFRQLARAQSAFDPTKIVSAEPSRTLITSPGTYQYVALGLTLKVWVDTSGLVQYDLSGADGQSLAHSTERASTYSRWALLIDDRKRLWFFSGDIGAFLWDGTGQTSRPLGTDDPVRGEMPAVLKAYLPRSLKKYFPDS
jgi:hypothetical protein